MQISAISGQVVTANSGVQKNSLPHSIGKKKEFEYDSFSKNNNVSFKGHAGIGALVGFGIGVPAGIAAMILTGGLATPFLLPYYAALAGSTAVGAGVGAASDIANSIKEQKEAEAKNKTSGSS